MSGKFEKRLLTELRDKEYRDTFVEGHIRTGAAYQIRALRNARDLSQEELGERAEMTQSVIARLENPEYGKFSLTTLIKLASAFDVALLVRFVSFSELLRRTSDLSPKGLNAPSFDEDRRLRIYESMTFSMEDASSHYVPRAHLFSEFFAKKSEALAKHILHGVFASTEMSTGGGPPQLDDVKRSKDYYKGKLFNIEEMSSREQEWTLQ